jgi:hypothetical protein
MEWVSLVFGAKKGEKSYTLTLNFLVFSLPFLGIFDPVLQLLYCHLRKKETEFIIISL